MSEELFKAELETLKKDVSSIKTDVKAIRDWQLTTRLCPSPGSCDPLKVAVNDHEKRLRFCERFMWILFGICSLINFLISAAK